MAAFGVKRTLPGLARHLAFDPGGRPLFTSVTVASPINTVTLLARTETVSLQKQEKPWKMLLPSSALQRQ